MLRKKLALFLVTAMVLTTAIPAAYAADTVVDIPPAITSEDPGASGETADDESAMINDSAPSEEDTAGNNNADQQKDTGITQDVQKAEEKDESVNAEVKEAPIVDETKESIMYKHLIELSETIGARVASTDKEREAKEYIEGVFKGLGYSTVVQPFEYTTKKGLGQSSNVIATKPGTSDKQIIVGAHYDSVNASTGASDNASGVSVMLGAAEVLKDVNTEYTIKFVAFGAEEVGLKGSQYYASQMSEEEIADTVGMINLDTVLFGDKKYVYGGLGEKSWLCDQALDLAKSLDLDIITQQGLNSEYPKGTTGDWSDHVPFKELGIPWIYFESTNWDLTDENGNYSTGESETEQFGEIMHTKRDNLSFMEEQIPGRAGNRLYSYTLLLSQLLQDIEPPVSSHEFIVSTNLLSMSEAREVTITVDLGYTPELENLSWTLGGKAFEEWKSFNSKDKDFTGKPFIKLGEPALDGGKVKAILKCELPFGTDNLQGRPYPRRVYPQLLGEYELVVTDKSNNVQAKTVMKLNAYDSYHKQTEILPAVERIIKEAKTDRYIEYAPLGKSAEGRDIPFVIFAKDRADVDKYLNETVPMMLEHPAEFIGKIENGTAGEYKTAIWFNNIHSDESNGVDAQLDLLEQLAGQEEISFKRAVNNNSKDQLEDVTLNVAELLDNYIVLFSLNNNPDGRFYNTRETASGFDPNRDVTYQTQVEMANVFQALAKWSPTIFNDFHGFVKDFLIEPCTPPHEPNFEYDLLMDGAIEHAHALGKAGIANTKYSNYIIPMFDYGQGWDDGAPMYAAVLSLMHGAVGHTVEIPELNQESNNAFMYAGLGSLKYALENKEKLFKNQLEIYKRGVEGIDAREVDEWLINAKGESIGRPRGSNENFFPEYYVLPVNNSLQKNSLAAYEMAEFLIKNGIKVEQTNTDVQVDGVTYPKGSFIVPMHQAKRGLANCVLYDGSDFSDFSEMYAEVTMCFPQLRGFDKYEIRAVGAFDGKTDSLDKVIIPATGIPSGATRILIKNTNNDAVKAVNELLAENKSIYMIYSAGDGFVKGDFIAEAKDLETIKNKYFLELAPFNGRATVKALKQPKVAGNGSELIYVLNGLGFNLVDSYSSADVIADESSYAMPDSIKNAIQSGTSYVGIGGYGVSAVESSGLLSGLEVGSNGGYYEGVLKADLDTDSVITGRYSKNDILYNNSASWIEKVPKTSKVLAVISNKDDFYVAGWWPDHDVLKGKPYIIQDQIGNAKITLFASHITNKAHPSHQFRLLANAIYDGMSGTMSELNSSQGGKSGGSKNKNSKTEIKKPSEETNTTTENNKKIDFKDVNASSWFSPAVNYVVQKGIMNGLDEHTFGPNVKTNRAMIVTMLHRLEGQPNAGSSNFSDVKSSSWYGASVAWANLNGIVTGYEGNQFMPANNISREQLAAILYRYAKYKNADVTVKGNTDNFSDHGQISSYAREAIDWAVGTGLMTGKTGNLLDPKGTATRAEVAAMFQRIESLIN